MNTSAPSDPLARRNHIAVSANPNGRADYLSTHAARFHPLGPDKAVALTIRYVPDRDLLDPAPLAAFLTAHDQAGWDSLEACAAAILDDLANELVPRWLQVTLSTQVMVDEKLTGCLEQTVIMEDRQPSWNNADLLNRLARR